MPAVVVLGARNLGGAIIDRFALSGWATAGVARSDETIAAIAARGAHAIRADALDPAQLAAALAEARSTLGGLDAIVNAMSVAAPVAGEPWGGGPTVDASPDAWERWTAAISRMAFVFLREGARALRESGGGTLVQITNGSALRAVPGQGPLAAGHHALRASVTAARAELAPAGIRVCLLVADGPIWSQKNAARIEADGLTEDQVLSQPGIAAAVESLVTQPGNAAAHELVLTAERR